MLGGGLLVLAAMYVVELTPARGAGSEPAEPAGELLGPAGGLLGPVGDDAR
jgi:hypothetical protein